MSRRGRGSSPLAYSTETGRGGMWAGRVPNTPPPSDRPTDDTDQEDPTDAR